LKLSSYHALDQRPDLIVISKGQVLHHLRGRIAKPHCGNITRYYKHASIVLKLAGGIQRVKKALDENFLLALIRKGFG
jgi:hypothetical protein